MPVRLAHLATACLIATMLVLPSAPRAAPVLSAADPRGGWDLSTWVWAGDSGFDVRFRGADRSSWAVPARIDWSEASAHHFELSYTTATGTLTFRLDASADGTFDRTEIVSQTFSDFAGRGFRHIAVSAPFGLTHAAWVRDLTVNGVAFGDLTGGWARHASIGFIEEDGSFRDILIAGDLILSGDRWPDDRPRMTLRLGDDVGLSIPVAEGDAVPEPAGMMLLAVAAAGLAAIRRHRRSEPHRRNQTEQRGKSRST